MEPAAEITQLDLALPGLLLLLWGLYSATATTTPARLLELVVSYGS